MGSRQVGVSLLIVLGALSLGAHATAEEARARRIIVVGIDGATWDILDPLLKQGRLPTFARLIERGARATLLAEPGFARSGPSWTSIASGRVAEQHGIIRNMGQVEVARFWDVLSEQRLRSAIIGWILTYPVRPLYGWMLSGPFGKKQSYPPELLDRLESRLGPYTPRANLLDLGEPFVESVTRSTEQQMRYARAILQEKPWSVLAVVFVGSDRLQHFYWQYREPQYFDLAPDAPSTLRNRDVIDDWYLSFDALLNDLVRDLDLDRDTLIIVSDHGSKAQTNVQPQCNNLDVEYVLEQGGWLKRDENHSIVEAQTVARLDKSKLKNWRRVLVSDPSKLEAVREFVAGFKLARTGEACFDKISIEDGSLKFHFVHSRSFRFDDQFEMPKRSEKVPVQAVLNRSKMRTGTHTDRGILLAAGAGVRRGVRIDDLHNIQVGPTLLAILGVVPARDMRGQVAYEIFEAGYIPELEREVDSYDHLVPRAEDAYDADLLREHLRALGYVE